MTRALAACLCLAALPAAADETWSTPYGTMVYEVDIGTVAVLSFPAAAVWDLPGDARGQLYVTGLAGNLDGRGIMTATWVGPASKQGLVPACETRLTGPDGITSDLWGTAQVIFDAPSYPTGFTVLFGYCDSDRWLSLRAEAN